MSHILIVGMKTRAFATYLEAHGHTYTLLQDERKTKFPDKRFKHRVVVSFADKSALLARIDRLKKRPDAVVSTYENYIVQTAWIAQHLGLPGMTEASALACTDKELMRTAFSHAPEKISPDFAVVNSEEDLRRFATTHSFPLILKPASLAKSLLVTKNDSLDELIENYRTAERLLASTYQSYGSSRSPKLLIEEYLDGTIHSVDAFVGSNGMPTVLEQAVDYQTGYDVGYDDNFHYSRTLPSALPAADIHAIRHCAAVGITALGIKNSPAHIEIILTADGPRIVEIGARNGGYRDRMHSLADGIDIPGAAVATGLGKPVDLTPTRHNCCAVIELFPHTQGFFDGIAHLDELQQLASFHSMSLKAKPGERVGLSRDGFRACGFVVIQHADHAQFSRDMAYIQHSVSVLTRPQ